MAEATAACNRAGDVLAGMQGAAPLYCLAGGACINE